MKNYIEYRVMGSVKRVCVNPDCLQSKFTCQEGRSMAKPNHERPSAAKRQRQSFIAETLLTNDIENAELELIPENSTDNEEIAAVLCLLNEDKCIQTNIVPKYRSRSSQCQVDLVSQGNSPIKTKIRAVACSPFKVKSLQRSTAVREINFGGELSESDTTSPVRKKKKKQLQKKKVLSFAVEDTIRKIKNDPRFYVGIEKTCYFLVEVIATELGIPIAHLLLCLVKIRLNTKFRQLGYDFNISAAYAAKIFSLTIPKLASIMRPFLVTLDKSMIKRRLPMAFRHKFHYVDCIIDCLEISIQKPTKAVDQALTWSDYKSANTIKYLISSTPNGLINYVSPGYGGRVTDTHLVETCDFLKTLNFGMHVMADRGFKHIDGLLLNEGVRLVRPPSVTKQQKMTNKDVKMTKQIASLRIIIERIVRRVREFAMLTPHACVHSKHVKILDYVITIACGLVNLQGPIIKSG